MKKGAAKEELSPIERFCLDAYIANGNARLAYTLSRKEPEVTANEKSLSVLTSRWINSAKVTDYIGLRHLANTTDAEAKETTNRTRADTIAELNLLATASTNPKEKAQILLALSDLNKWKREETNTEKNIVFYIPLSSERSVDHYARLLANAFGWDEDTEAKAVKIMRQSTG